MVMLADPQKSHKLPCDLAGGYPYVTFVRDTEGNTLTRQNPKRVWLERGAPSSVQAHLLKLGAFFHPLAVVVLPIAVHRNQAFRHLAGWYMYNEFTIPALQQILSTPNVLFPYFGKLVYAYALVLFGSSFPIATEETKLTIDTTINNWPLFFYVPLADML